MQILAGAHYVKFSKCGLSTKMHIVSTIYGAVCCVWSGSQQYTNPMTHGLYNSLNLNHTDPALANPDLTNPDLINPDLANPDLTDPDITNSDH